MLATELRLLSQNPNFEVSLLTSKTDGILSSFPSVRFYDNGYRWSNNCFVLGILFLYAQIRSFLFVLCHCYDVVYVNTLLPFAAALYETYPFCRDVCACTVCRIEPENNVHLILEAFARMPEKKLVIVGNWEKSEYGRTLKEKYAGTPNLHLLAPVYEPHTVNWLRGNGAVGGSRVGKVRGKSRKRGNPLWLRT